jgi:branched-chain amino acid transport system ATP-binding protein
MPVLSVEGLNKAFGGLVAIHNFSFALNKGEILGVLGPNGSGKTTLFNIITGFIKPDTGKIRLNGKEITGLNPYQICRYGIARTFQIVKCFRRLSVLENVMAGRAYGKKPSRGIKQAESEANELLELGGLFEKRFMLAEQLGHTEMKRLETIMAMATKPDLLLLDEMMAGLNPTETEDAIQYMKSIRHLGVSIMVVEHVMRAVLELSDRVMVINAGQKIADGTPREIIGNQEVIKVYLGEE